MNINLFTLILDPWQENKAAKKKKKARRE